VKLTNIDVKLTNKEVKLSNKEVKLTNKEVKLLLWKNYQNWTLFELGKRRQYLPHFRS